MAIAPTKKLKLDLQQNYIRDILNDHKTDQKKNGN